MPRDYESAHPMTILSYKQSQSQGACSLGCLKHNLLILTAQKRVKFDQFKIAYNVHQSLGSIKKYIEIY